MTGICNGCFSLIKNVSLDGESEDVVYVSNQDSRNFEILMYPLSFYKYFKNIKHSMIILRLN